MAIVYSAPNRGAQHLCWYPVMTFGGLAVPMMIMHRSCILASPPLMAPSVVN